MEITRGRGEQATADMKARIAFLRSCGADIFQVLWERHHRAVKLQQGFEYDFAPELVRPAGDRGGPGDG